MARQLPTKSDVGGLHGAAYAMRPGSIIAKRYRVVKELGRGGMGAVYLVEHTNTSERLALKVLRAEMAGGTRAAARFRREMRASALIRSDHVVRVTDADVAEELGGAPYLVMELLDGCDFARTIAARGPMPPEEVLFVMGQAMRALTKAHAQGIVHRDLKPENIFLHITSEGTLQVKVLDFGVARFRSGLVSGDTRLTQDTSLIGTPLYMSPEQMLGEHDHVGPETDVWALGMVAYEALARTAYWPIVPFARLVALITTSVMPKPSEQAPALPRGFDAWFARSCARESSDRFSTIEEQVRALAGALQLNEQALLRPAPPALLEFVRSARVKTSGDALRGDGARVDRSKSVPPSDPNVGGGKGKPSRRRSQLALLAPIALLVLSLVFAGYGAFWLLRGPVRKWRVGGPTTVPVITTGPDPSGPESGGPGGPGVLIDPSRPTGPTGLTTITPEPGKDLKDPKELRDPAEAVGPDGKKGIRSDGTLRSGGPKRTHHRGKKKPEEEEPTDPKKYDPVAP